MQGKLPVKFTHIDHGVAAPLTAPVDEAVAVPDGFPHRGAHLTRSRFPAAQPQQGHGVAIGEGGGPTWLQHQHPCPETPWPAKRRHRRPHGGVLAWLQVVKDADLHLASVTIGEFQAGIELSRDQDPTKTAEIEQWLNRVCDTFNILPMDGPAFRCWAQLQRQSDTLYEDAMIAAIARVHQLTMVTRNLNDLSRFDVPLLNQFSVGLSQG